MSCVLHQLNSWHCRTLLTWTQNFFMRASWHASIACCLSSIVSLLWSMVALFISVFQKTVMAVADGLVLIGESMTLLGRPAMNTWPVSDYWDVVVWRACKWQFHTVFYVGLEFRENTVSSSRLSLNWKPQSEKIWKDLSQECCRWETNALTNVLLRKRFVMCPLLNTNRPGEGLKGKWW